MSSWKQLFNTLVLLATAGFALVITSLLWRVAAFLLIAGTILWLWKQRRRR